MVTVCMCSRPWILVCGLGFQSKVSHEGGVGDVGS